MSSMASPLLFAPATMRQVPPSLEVTPLHSDGIYTAGENVGWAITLHPGDTAPAGSYSFVIRENNARVIKSGMFDLTSGKAEIGLQTTEPEMLYLQITPPPGGGRMRAFGAAVSPSKLKPVHPRPRDFDAFWKSKIRELERIPMNPELMPKESGNPNVEYATIKMDHVNGTHVYGQIAKPNRPGKFPAIVIFQWASPPYPLQRSWVTDRAKEGWLALNIEPHDVLPDGPPSYYQRLPAELKNYAGIGQDDRDRCYFLQMYLADYRAIDYILTRPDWDGKTLVVNGTSMGGQQSLCVAGLHPRITHVVVEEPSGCDLNAAQHDRQAGYPNFQTNNPKVSATAPYFDAINFASHIRATSLVAMGFLDTAAPPAGVWTAFNLIRGRKEAAPMFEAPHNNMATYDQQRPYFSRSAAWLDALVHGRPIPPPDPGSSGFIRPR